MRIAKIVISTLLYLTAFDVIGVAACLFFEVAGVLPLSIGAVSAALFYTVWIVAGIFCGLLSYDAGGRRGSIEGPGDWTGREGAGRTGLLVLSIESAIVAVLWALFRFFLWGSQAASDNYVPDNRRLTSIFLAAVVASVILAHTRLRPTQVQPGSSAVR